MHRRTLLKYLAMQSMVLPFALQANTQRKTESTIKPKRLVLIELKGGNDGLNTVIPYNNPRYYQLRPNIAIKKAEVLPLNDYIGLHPAMKEMKDIFIQGESAIVQGIGYPEPNRSHFRSIEIWDTASKSQEYLQDGWLSKLTFNKKNKGNITGIVLGGNYGPLAGNLDGVIMINNVKHFLKQSEQLNGRISLMKNNEALSHILQTETEISKSAKVLKTSLKTVELPYPYKKTKFFKQMKVATELMYSGSSSPFIFKMSLGSFDTHSNQKNKHTRLLKELSQGIDTMRKNLIASGGWNDTVIMTYSEFGRRVSENGSKGTDHGTAAPHFIIGGAVQGGIYGEHPSLNTLDNNEDLIYTTDFRSMYKTITQEWFKTSSPQLSTFAPISSLKFSVERSYGTLGETTPDVTLPSLGGVLLL